MLRDFDREAFHPRKASGMRNFEEGGEVAKGDSG